MAKRGKKDVTLEEFLDLAGHELRIPVTVLKGQIQLLRRRWGRVSGHDPDVADLDRLLFQTERLNYMLQVLLDAFHVSQSPLQLLPPEYDYDLAQVVRHAVSSTAASTADHDVRLEEVGDGEPLLGNWDRTRIETVLSVLLSNAAKYSPPGKIEVRLSREATMACIEVSDTGPGVPAKDRVRIFQPYTHGSNVQNPGSGLGLFVAREIVRAHGGRIGHRPTKGGGSTFWFTLPLKHYPTLADQAVACAQAAAEADGASAEPAVSVKDKAPAPGSGRKE